MAKFRTFLTTEDGSKVEIPNEAFHRMVLASGQASEFIVGENHGEAFGKLLRSLWPELVESAVLRELAGEALSDDKLVERWRQWTARPIPGTHGDWRFLAHWVGIDAAKDVTDEWIDGELLPALAAKKRLQTEKEIRQPDSAFVAAKTLRLAQVTVSIDVDAIQATIRTPKGEETIDLPSKQVARWLKVLCERPRQWIPASDLVTFDRELDGARTNILSRSLRNRCPVLAKLIETDNHRGARFNPDLASKRNRAPRRATKC